MDTNFILYIICHYNIKIINFLFVESIILPLSNHYCLNSYSKDTYFDVKGCDENLTWTQNKTNLAR